MESNQGSRIAHRQRPQDHQVEEAESRHVDPDSDSQHQNRRDGEAGRFSQLTGRVPEILETTVDPGPAPGVTRFLPQAEGIAEMPAPLG